MKPSTATPICGTGASLRVIVNSSFNSPAGTAGVSVTLMRCKVPPSMNWLSIFSALTAELRAEMLTILALSGNSNERNRCAISPSCVCISKRAGLGTTVAGILACNVMTGCGCLGSLVESVTVSVLVPQPLRCILIVSVASCPACSNVAERVAPVQPQEVPSTCNRRGLVPLLLIFTTLTMSSSIEVAFISCVKKSIWN